MDNSYFRVYRKIFKNPIWDIKPYSKGQAWVDLFGMANYKPQTIILGNDEVEIQRGQFHTSELKLAEKWGWSRKKVRAYLDQLERLKMVTTVGTPKGTTITIENYEFYQGDSTTDDTTEGTLEEHQRNIKGTSKGTQTKKIKKDKKENKDIYKGLDEKLHQPLKDFIEMRKAIKKPLTDRATQMILDKLQTLSNGDINTSVKILQQSTMNCWQGVFPLKEETIAKTKDGQANNDSGTLYDYDKFFTSQKG